MDAANRKTTCALYMRISRDPTGRAAGVERQEEDCRALATRRGWEVKEPPYVDNDVSAYSGKRRPAYRRMLDDIKAGEVGAVVAWHSDRFYRRRDDLAEFVKVLEAAKCQVDTVKAGTVDLSTATGRMVAGILGEVSIHESAQKGERILRAQQQKRERGESTGHGRRPYGYEIIGKKVSSLGREVNRYGIEESEAAIIREIRDRVFAGENLNQITAGLIKRSVVTAEGKRWRRPNLQHMMTSARISGRMERSARRPDGEHDTGRMGEIVGPGDWPAIISPEESDRLRAMFASPLQRGRYAKHLLTGGIAVCGICGRNLTVSQRSGNRKDSLACQKWDPADTGACGRCSIVYAPVEEHVTEAVLRRVDQGALRAMYSSPDNEAFKELAGVEEQLIQNRRDYTDKLISRAVWEDEHKRLTARETALKRRVQAALVGTGLEGLPDPLRPAWGDLELPQQRTVVKALVDAVVIAPANKQGARRVDLDRIGIRWKA